MLLEGVKSFSSIRGLMHNISSFVRNLFDGKTAVFLVYSCASLFCEDLASLCTLLYMGKSKN